jgi:hypothetical protein
VRQAFLVVLLLLLLLLSCRLVVVVGAQGCRYLAGDIAISLVQRSLNSCPERLGTVWTIRIFGRWLRTTGSPRAQKAAA